MPADKLGRYMTSPEFLKRANVAVVEAARQLEAKGIKPVYLDRKTGRIVGGEDDQGREKGSCEGQTVPDILKNNGPRQRGYENER